MRVEYRLGQTACLEQREAKQHRVAHAAPHGGAQITADGDRLHQHRVDCHTDDNKKGLEAEGKQRSEIVLTHAACLLAHHSRHWDRCDGGDQVDLDHAPVGNEKHTDRNSLHGDTHKQTLEPEAEQFADLHALQSSLQPVCHGGYVDAGIADDHAGRPVDNALRHIKDAHDDVPGVRDDQHRSSGFERPLEEHPGIQIVEIVLFCDQMDQLQGHDKGEDQPGDGNDDCFRKVLDHRKNAAVPCLRGRSHIARDLTDLLVGAVEHPGQIAHDAVDQNVFQPVCDFGPQLIQCGTSFLPSRLTREGGDSGY